jgi:uncharacterized membrane protein
VVTVRWLRHLLTTGWKLRRCFPPPALEAIRRAIEEGERRHGGEVLFAIETCLDVRRLLVRQSARDRALEVFAELRAWDTEANVGVLIYLLLAERDIEIVADRGLSGHVTDAEWQSVCRAIEEHLHAGRFEAGAVEGIRLTSALIARHFPPRSPEPNELPDTPVIL